MVSTTPNMCFQCTPPWPPPFLNWCDWQYLLRNILYNTMQSGAHCDKIDARSNDVFANAIHNPTLYKAYPHPDHTVATGGKKDNFRLEWAAVRYIDKALGAARARNVVWSLQDARIIGWMLSNDLRTANIDETRIVPIPSIIGPMALRILDRLVLSLTWIFVTTFFMNSDLRCNVTQNGPLSGFLDKTKTRKMRIRIRMILSKSMGTRKYLERTEIHFFSKPNHFFVFGIFESQEPNQITFWEGQK